ncbi:DUF1211 domain-containing protein [Candidatus Peregrinibacteria bacterium]|nr:DUF1211 domain-containing protein [Candidatus Peregrinibacteria bacterium]
MKKLQIQVPSTARLEAFSDGILAFVATLMVASLDIPSFISNGLGEFTDYLGDLLPRLGIFAFSFFTICVIWVNHHHFFHQLKKLDWKILWLNNLMLFFVTLIPFITATVAEKPLSMIPLLIYGLSMSIVCAFFWRMVAHAFLRSNLLEEEFEIKSRKKEVNKAMMATLGYLAAGFVSLVNPLISLILIILIPCFFVIPTIVTE